jgi:adenylosuccinate lyase
MLVNLAASHGLVFSHRLLLALVESGLPREEAYRLVQAHAMEAWDTGSDFRGLVEADPAIAPRLDAAALASAFDLEATVRHVDTVFERLHSLARKEPVNV